MIKSNSYFSRVLCALLLCAGLLCAGCTDDPLGGGENTEQGGNNDGGGSGESADPVSISLGDITATTVQFDMTLDIEAMSQYEEAGLIFSSVDDLDVSAETATLFQINRESCSKVFTGLTYNTKYYYTTYLKYQKKGAFYHYGEKKEFTTPNVVLGLSMGSITATTAQITGTVEGLSDSDKSLIEVGIFYSSEEGKVENGQGTKLTASEIPSDNAVSFSLSELSYGTTYYYCSYVKQSDGYVYGEVKTFVAGSVSVSLSVGSITATTAQISGTVEGLSDSDKSLIEVGMFYSSEEGKVENGQGTKLTASEISSDNAVSFSLSQLTFGTTYYYCSYVKQGEGYVYGEVKTFVAGSVSVSLSVGSITATTAQITGTVEGLSESDKSLVEVGMFYSAEEGKVENGQGTKLTASEISSDNAVSFSLSELTFGTTYYYCSYVKQSDGYVYGEVKTFVAGSVSVTLSDASSITATTAQISGTVEGLSESDKSQIQVGMFYSAEEGKVENGQGTKLTASEISSDNAVSFSLSQLTFGTTYYYCSYVKQGTASGYGEIKTFVTGNVSVSVSAKESTIVSGAPVAEFAGVVKGLSEEDKSDIEVGVAYYTTSEGLKTNSSTKVAATSVISDGTFELSKQLSVDTKYYYCSYVKQNSEYVYGAEINELQTIHPYSVPSDSDLNVSSATDLSSSASANCYIVSNAGLYKFKTVKGNSSESVGNVASTSILWETFGTSDTPECLDLIKAVDYENGYLAFQTADTFKEGNAVIAAKDASGKILWSWHIWLTDEPQGQVYYNNAGTMMDRNLGATSATPGDVGALGLHYQWGRKDPFLGSSSISSNTLVNSTITWPSAVSSNSSNGTIAYATAHPTTFITGNEYNRDWYYTGSKSTDNTRWTTSESNKSIYDPCPSGWRVPDGGSNGVWSKACSSSYLAYTYNSTNEGMNFSGEFGADQTIWYPATGCRYDYNASLDHVGSLGWYWSASPDNYFAHDLYFFHNGAVYPSDSSRRAYGLSVRCLQVID